MTPQLSPESLEQIRQVVADSIGAAIGGLERRLDPRLAAIEHRLESHDHRFDAVDQRFAEMNQRFATTMQAELHTSTGD